MAAIPDQRDSSPGGELLNALSPSRILPNHVIAVRRWRRINEKNINNKIRRNIRDKRAIVLEGRDINFKRNKKIPLDILTKDWLENIGGTDELRVYLIDNCLPSLVLGLESLLEEVGKAKDNFNPLNYLAQHLMRNNPRYNHLIKNSPYMKGLNEVKTELRQLVAKLRHSKSAKITSDARKRRYQRQTKEALEPAEMDRRTEITAKSFQKWSFGDETIPQYKIQRALRSFMEEKVPKFNEEMREVCKYIQPVPLDDRKDAISCQQYCKYVMDRTEGWPIGAFGALMQHIEACAKAVPVGDQRQRLQHALTSLFRSIDKEQENQLNRAHILTLIKEFYGNIPINMKKYITNPLDWSDKDTVYSPTPTPSVMTTPFCGSASIPVYSETPITIDTPAVDEPMAAQELTTEPSSPEKTVRLPPEDDAQTSPTPTVHIVHTTVENTEHDDLEAPNKKMSARKSIFSLQSETSIGDDFVPVTSVIHINSPSSDESPSVKSPTDESPSDEPWITEINDEEEVQLLKHDIELIGEEIPSHLTQPRDQEIDTKINLEEFIYVTERLLGEDPHPRALTALSEFLEDSFQETPQQRQSRQLDEKLAAKHHAMMTKINDLFDEWDVDKLGYLDRTEILAVLSQWQKNSTKPYNVEMSKQICKSVEEVDKKDLLREDFLKLCHSFHKVLDSDDYMDRLLDFVGLVVQTQRGDLRRERKRRRWLEVMHLLPKISGSDHNLYFRSFFDIIEKDFAYHGSGRLINAYIALIETDPDADDEDEDKTLLRYVASTANDQNILMGRTLYATQKCISNQVRRSGKAVYINQIRNNNQVHLWAMDRWAVDEDRDGAFLVLPLKNDTEKVVGVVGVDTLLSSNPTQFLPHEITFIQNVVRQLSSGFSFLDARHKFSRTLISLLETIPRKESAVLSVSCYVVEPLPHVPSGPSAPDAPEEFALRHTMSLNPKTGIVEMTQGVNRETIRKSDSSFRYIEEEAPENTNMNGKSCEPQSDSDESVKSVAPDNHVRDYLFNCLEKKENIQNRAYGTDHLAMRVDDKQGVPIFVIDLDTGKDKSHILKAAQIKSVRNLFNKLVLVFGQLLEEVESDEKKYNSGEEGHIFVIQ
ncbi:uncharacterized protein LOC134826824 [Bolinopsis microptera]|uniref:uncharacterized protein LOC134826824 n=1 Tax=Bolinopsis microptera TaxID=2820187 RepID=UPI003079AF77